MSEFKLGQIMYGVTSNGNVKTWRAKVYGTPTAQVLDATIEIITQTKLDGKEISRHEVITQGKNLGKSNATTPYEQAVSEAESRYRKKLDQGYKLTIPTDLSKSNYNALNLPKPMLAYAIEKVKNIEFDQAHLQPKLNGHRCLATKQDGKTILYSRQGKLITTMGHIVKQLEDQIEEGEFLDGELYINGELLQNIGAFIKKRQPGSEKVEYHIYDMIMSKSYTQRYNRLVQIVTKEGGPVVLIETTIVSSVKEAQELTLKYIDDGYEGGILRLPDSTYRAGFRSRELLKLKTFEDAEFEVIDIIEGQDKCVNDTFFKVAVLVCITEDGEQFKVTAHGNAENKQQIWHDRNKHIGRLVTVKYYEKTAKNVPFHPIALQWKEDI